MNNARLFKHPGQPLLLLSVACLGLSLVAPPACDTVPIDSDNDFIDPEAPGYLPILLALGIQQEMDRVARTLPPYLCDVPGLDGEGPFEVEKFSNVTYRVTPQRGLDMDVYRPVSSDPKLRRAVVLYMGGGWVTDLDFDTIGVWAEYLASRGFVAFNTRQRLVTEANVTRRDVISDAIAAVQYVVAEGPRFGADPDRIATMGRSSGGQLALLVGMAPSPDKFGDTGRPDTPLSVRAIIDIFGSVDDAAFFNNPEFTLLPIDALKAVYGGTPDEVPDAYVESAPITYVRAGLPPTLIVHGALDTTIPPSHSVRLADALDATGVTVQREFYPQYGHVIGWGLFNNDGFGTAIQAIIRFLEREL